MVDDVLRFYKRKGPVSQRQLVKLLCPLIDVAASKVSSKSRDEARKLIRETLLVANWQTPFVFHNLKQRRCRFLTRMGYIIPNRWLLNLDADAQIKNWAARRRDA